MNITTFDFVVLTGLGFTGEPLAYQEDFVHIVINSFTILVPSESISHEDHLFYSILVDLMQDDEQWSRHSTDQQSRCILTLILNMTVSANLSNHCHFYYLVYLVDLNRVRSMN